ncbi:unnamed protein product [Leptosia nina]|uniref:Uncharacterized protein n=1 Tax=Leptosia nina TaxID=320188 RepID=A0AAV1JNA3_9NEOP
MGSESDLNKCTCVWNFCQNEAAMSGCNVMRPFLIIMLLHGITTAPVVPTLFETPIFTLSSETRGLEVPLDVIAGAGVGMSSVQLVVNVHTDKLGNIEVETN